MELGVLDPVTALNFPAAADQLQHLLLTSQRTNPDAPELHHSMGRCFPPGSPLENPYMESLNRRYLGEFLNIQLLASVPEAKLSPEQARIEYNPYRPHSALQELSSLEVLQQWKAA